MSKPSIGSMGPFILSLSFAGMVAVGMYIVPAPQMPLATAAAAPASTVASPTAAELAQASAQAQQQELADRIASHYKVEPEFAQDVVGMAHDAAQEQGVDPVLLLALVAVESSFNPEAVSHANARGLTQVIAKWHPEKVEPIEAQGRSIMEPEANLHLGAQILAEYQRKFDGDTVLALQQYNGSLKDQTRKYSRKVITMYDFLSLDPSRT